MTPDALLPVGKDCDCGFPLVWRHGKQWCSVYGSHPVSLGMRDRTAVLANVVDELAAMPMPKAKKGHKLRRAS